MARPKLCSAVVVLVHPQMRLALEVVQPRLRRADLEGPLDHLDAFAELALLEREHGDVIERIDVAGVLLQDRHIALHGEVVLALPVQRQRLLEGIGGFGGGRGRFMARFMPQPLAGWAIRPGGPATPPWYGFCLIIPRESGRGRAMKDILDRLEQRREQARLGGGAGPHRGAAQARQADRPRAHRAAARQGLVRGVRHVRRAPLQRLRHGEAEDPGRRRGHRLGHRQRPHRVPVRQGLHRVRRLAVGDPRAEDHQGAGRRDEGARADHRPVRRRRRPHPGGRRFARAAMARCSSATSSPRA